MSRYRQNMYDSQRFDYNAVINRILENKEKPIQFSERDFNEILPSAKSIFLDQPNMLQLEAPLKIVGNINGHFRELVNIFKMSGYPGEINYLFLGDYVDRGPMSLEVIMLLLCYKIRFPENIFMLRGHHEVASVNRLHGFYDECKDRVGIQFWKMFNDVFNVMPLCAVIEHKIFCVHGGLSPEMESLNQVSRVQRPLSISNNGIPLDLLWSDPQSNMSGWQDNERGISYSYGADVVFYFLKNNNYDLMVRSHQVVQNGYEFMFQKQLVTLFSVPNYLGEYQNYGAIMAVEEDLQCSFEIIKPKFKHRKDEVVPAGNNPFRK